MASDTKSTTTLAVSPYDRVASTIIALIVLVGFFVTLLLLLWLSQRSFNTMQAVPVQVIEDLAGRENKALGEERDLAEPGIEELADVAQPQLAESLAALTDVVSSQAAALDALYGSADSMGTGSGAGDNRNAGPGGEGAENIVPRGERWDIRFPPTNLNSYAKQLDYFKIELGAFGGGRPEADIAYNLSAGIPTVRNPASTEVKQRKEEWLHFIWSGPTKFLDVEHQILQKANVKTAGRTLVRFYPPDTENRLAAIEAQNLGGVPLQNVQKTVFGVRAAGDGYEFYFIEKLLRRTP